MQSSSFLEEINTVFIAASGRTIVGIEHQMASPRTARRDSAEPNHHRVSFSSSSLPYKDENVVSVTVYGLTGGLLDASE